MSDGKLTDDEAYETLHRALLELGRKGGTTVRADTALKAARRALTLLQIGLLAAHDEDSDRVKTVKDPNET